MKTLLRAIILIALLENWALADLVPATSEDLNDFDRQISLSQSKDAGAVSGRGAGKSKGTANAKKDNFGAAVSAEAKTLKDLPQDQRQGMGKWVSEQRKQNDQNQAGAGNNNGGGNGVGSAASNDARNSAPANKDAGNNGNGNGKNK